MMKKYIILTGAIRNAGGAQLYTANKLSYMENLGWQPFVFFHVSGECKIPYLNRFLDGYIPELGQPIQSLKQTAVSRVIEHIVSSVCNDGEIVIECNHLLLSFWGEALAKRLQAKCVLFPLEESFWNISKKEAAFFDFKLRRNEIMTGTEQRLRQLFKGFYSEEYRTRLFGLTPFCSNVIDYSPINLPSGIIANNTFKILSIGRLMKPYIFPMLEDVRSFARSHSQERFSLIIIGGDSNPKVEANIRLLFSDTKNVDLYLLGYIFPIPYDWIKVSDVCIASSNSVLVSANAGIPTISIDANDFNAIGVYGYTTNNTLYRQEEPQVSVSEFLDAILMKKKYPKTLSNDRINEDLANYFTPHVSFLEVSEKTKEYYSISEVYSSLERFIARLKRVARGIHS